MRLNFVEKFNQAYTHIKEVPTFLSELSSVFENVTGKFPMCGSPGELSKELVTEDKRKKSWGMNCDVGKATEGLENEL